MIRNNTKYVDNESYTDLIHETSKMLSQLTNYTVAMTKHLSSLSEIKYIQLVRMHESEILLIVVTDDGDIKKQA